RMAAHSAQLAARQPRARGPPASIRRVAFSPGRVRAKTFGLESSESWLWPTGARGQPATWISHSGKHSGHPARKIATGWDDPTTLAPIAKKRSTNCKASMSVIALQGLDVRHRRENVASEAAPRLAQLPTPWERFKRLGDTSLEHSCRALKCQL